jgi:hypothetical protein
MNFLRAKTTWSNIEFAIIKVSLISYGIIIGIYFTTFLKKLYFMALAVVWHNYYMVHFTLGK